MSAIHDGPRLVGSTRKHHSSAKVIVHSHNRQEPYDLSDDVWSIQTGKTIKGVGQANITLVPRINFLNAIGPNDYVNIYFDKHDGKGRVRTFFGLVDRIEEEYSVSDTGEPITNYHIICSDFAKIFESTEYYTNPHLHTHDSFVNSSIGNLLPKLAIRTQGLLLQGGPADMVTQIIFTFLGFSQQFTLPESYASAITNTSVLDENRGLRLQTAESLLNETQIQGIGEGGVQGLLTNATELTQRQTAGLEEPPSSSEGRADILRQVAESLEVDIAEVDSMRSQNPQAFNRLLTDANISRELHSLPGSSADTDVGTITRSVGTILRGASPALSPTVLDLINVGTFIERETIDGFTFNSAIPNYHGNITNLLRQHSHDIVNELFFDLRAVSQDSTGFSEGAQWSTDPDEIAGNIDEHGGAAGVRYVPAVVMRENPFSTIDKVDASGVTLGLRGPNNELLSYGLFPIGAIFSSKPNSPGRHVIDFPNINAVDKMQGRNTPGKRHLDVATISTADISKTQWGRSDTDHVNLTGLISQSFLGRSAQFYMKDLSPTISPIHVQRHGLRVRILTTRFARLHASANQGQQATRPAAVSNPTAGPVENPATAEQVENPEPVEEEYRTNVWVPPAIVTKKHPLEIHDNVLFTSPSAGTRWGYVRYQTGTNNTERRMHNGIDIYGEVGTRIQAIADGIIVKKFRNGQQNVYGNMLVIKHPGMGEGGTNIYSVYAHMGRPRDLGPNNTRNENYVEGEDISEAFARIDADTTNTGRRLEIGDRVRAGQHIGYMGWTSGIRPNHLNSGLYRKNTFRYRPPGGGPAIQLAPPGVHLHFEITREVGRQATYYPSNAGNGGLQRIPLSDWTRSSGSPPFHRNPNVKDRLCSLDPVEFLLNKGVNLLEPGVMDQRNSGNPDTTEPELDLIEPDDEAVLDQEVVTENAGVENQETADQSRIDSSTQGGSGTGVDNTAIRNLLARWMILQDHWYQHNLEYLSGSIAMSRGAPEIRVGYRLDIVDRALSFYVESVNHNWQHGGALNTTLKVTRGQPNNPFPAYILPRNPGFSSSEDQRFLGSRLGKYFIIPDPVAVKRGRVIRYGYDGVHGIESPETNVLDEEQTLNRSEETYISSMSLEELDLSEEELASLDGDSASYARSLTKTAVESSSLPSLINSNPLPIDGANILDAFTEIDGDIV